MSSAEIHPKFQDIEGFSGRHAVNHYQAVQVYIDLSECKGWWNLEVKPCPKAGLLFLSGHETQFEPQSFVLPVRSDGEMSMEDLDVYKETVKEAFNSDMFLLGIVDSDSAVVYYRISGGLVPPERPEQLEAKKLKSLRYRERRKQRNMKYTHIADTVSIKSGLVHKTTPTSASVFTCYTSLSDSSAALPQAASCDTMNTQTFSTKTGADIIGYNEPCTSKPQNHTAEHRTTIVDCRVNEKQSSLFDSLDEKRKESKRPEKESNENKTIKTHCHLGGEHRMSIVDGIVSKRPSSLFDSLDENCRESDTPQKESERIAGFEGLQRTTESESKSNSKDCSLLSTERTQSGSVGEPDCGIHFSSPQRSSGTSVVEADQGQATELDVEENEDRTMDEAEEMEAGDEDFDDNDDDDDDNRVPNMAPEDFEDVQYSDDEFVGEL